MAALLAGKNLLITGVITEKSIAFAAARIAQENGANVVLTGYGRLSLVEMVARRLPAAAPVIPLDVTDAEQLAALGPATEAYAERIDGVLHAIAYAPAACLGGYLTAPWPDVAQALHASTYSYPALAKAVAPRMPAGSGIVGLTFDSSRAWPAYDWMGVAKAGLEAANRYLATYLGPRGIRANLVAAGPLRTVAGRGIPGLADLRQAWSERAPLGWDGENADAAARACLALLSDWFPATTGEIVRVDGGYHATGA